MKIQQEHAGLWFVTPETIEDINISTLKSTSGPWNTKEAAELAAKGKFVLAHATHNKAMS